MKGDAAVPAKGGPGVEVLAGRWQRFQPGWEQVLYRARPLSPTPRVSVTRGHLP